MKQLNSEELVSSNEIEVLAQNVGKTFVGGSVVALEEVSIEIRKGTFVSLVGPSGCGKSTMLRLIAGLIDRTSGELSVHGTSVSGPRQDVAMMFQKATLLEWRTALENVLLPTEIQHTPTNLDKSRAVDLLEMVGLKNFIHSFPAQLSGGMQQRVALARLLQSGADLLLLDEPFGALDEFTREHLNIELLKILDEVQATTVFVTHNISEAIFLADKVVVMTPHPGRIAKIVEIELARPRQLSIQTSVEFNRYVEEVRKVLGGY